MTSKPTVYLAGPVAAYADGGASWRDGMIADFGDVFDFRNPLSKYNVPVDDLEIVVGESHGDNEVSITELVDGDKEMLRDSDAVVVGYSDVQSIGTPMEVMWAYEREMPVGIWIRDGTPFDAVSPWYRYHATTITNARDKTLARIKQEVADE